MTGSASMQTLAEATLAGKSRMGNGGRFGTPGREHMMSFRKDASRLSLRTAEGLSAMKAHPSVPNLVRQS